LRGVGKRNLDYEGMGRKSDDAVADAQVVKNGLSPGIPWLWREGLYDVDPNLGDAGGSGKLCAGRHKQHMKILIDCGDNHVGTRNPGEAPSAMPGWFHGNAGASLDPLRPQKGRVTGLLPDKKEIPMMP